MSLPQYDIYAGAEMLIRRPVAEVFQAFIDPEITSKFWFTRSTGLLKEGESVTWYWDMYGASSPVTVREIIPLNKIAIDWGQPATPVDFLFEPYSADATYVQAINYNLYGEGRELADLIRDLTGGFTTVLDGLKAYLEHGIRLNLVADKFPAHHTDAWKNGAQDKK